MEGAAHMKKSGFIALILGTVSGVLFALGMCMALLPEWDAFTEGVLFGVYGLLIGMITIFVWCKMENKKLPELKGKNLLLIAFGVLGVLILGAGMCLCLVWEQIVWGTLIGLLGIILLISLIPLVKGIK